MKKAILIAALVFILPLSIASMADAVSITLSDGLGASLTVNDGGAGDLNPAAGQITVINGTVGQFTFTSFSATFTISGPNLTMNWTGNNVVATGVGTLNVSIDGNLGGWDLKSGTFSTSGNQGTAGLTSGTSSALSGANTIFGPLTWDTRPGAFAWGSGQSLAGIVTGVNAISETASITFYGAGAANPGGSLTGTVPEPSTLLLLGLGLAGIGIVRAYRK